MWISEAVAPDEAKTYAEQIENALLAGETDKTQHLARAFQDCVLKRIEDMLALAQTDDKAERRIGVQIGTPRGAEEVKTLAGMLQARDMLAMLGGQIPGHIKSLSSSSLESVKAQLDSRLSSHPDAFIFALIMVMGRLAASWQLVRLATRAANSDAAARIAETPYSAAVAIVLSEIARMVAELGDRSQERPWRRGRRDCSRTSTTRCAACGRNSTCPATRRGRASLPRSAPTFRSCSRARST